MIPLATLIRVNEICLVQLPSILIEYLTLLCTVIMNAQAFLCAFIYGNTINLPCFCSFTDPPPSIKFVERTGHRLTVNKRDNSQSISIQSPSRMHSRQSNHSTKSKRLGFQTG